MALKSHSRATKPEFGGIVAFPSFHTILAILSVRALWGIGKLRAIGTALGVAICLSTVATGWHYVIDVLSGIAVQPSRRWLRHGHCVPGLLLRTMCFGGAQHSWFSSRISSQKPIARNQLVRSGNQLRSTK